MAPEEEIVIGIDLGTTFSCAAVVREGKPKIIPSEKGYLTVPSVVGLGKKGDLIVGHPALDQMVVNPSNTIYSSKRLIGRKFTSMVVQKMIQTMHYPIVPGERDEAAVLLGDKQYSLTQISSFILSEVKDMAQGQLGHEIRRAIITVPAYYNDNQRQAVMEAGKLAGLTVERIVNEPTAAAVAYGYNKRFRQRILVYDMGGGTVDVSILDVADNTFRVLAAGGDTFLGGVDFDTRMAEHVIEQFKKSTGKDLKPEKVATQRVISACERAKRELSVEKVAQIDLPYITEINKQPVDLRMKLTRDQLNKLTKDLVERTVGMCDEVLRSIGMTTKNIDEILLVGGQTRMPLVQEEIERYFGKPPKKGVHPDEVVALGAAVLGSTYVQEVQVQLIDVLSIPIGICLPNGSFKVVIEKNTPLPAEKSYKLTMKKSEPIEIDIYQGEAKEIFENEYLGSFYFPPPPKQRGKEQKLEMRFELSAQCLLGITARDLDTGETTSARMVTRQTPQSLVDSVKAAVAKGKKSGGFLSLAQRILGRP